MIKLEFDLMCKKKVPALPYRIIVNGELMTERDYIWDNNIKYIRECIPLDIPSGTHTLDIQNLDHANGTFSINNVSINGKAHTMHDKEFKT